jgi:hypothetical protein
VDRDFIGDRLIWSTQRIMLQVSIVSCALAVFDSPQYVLLAPLTLKNSN